MNLTHLSSKELIKNEVSNGSQDVDVLHQTISRGDSVTNEVINNLVFEAIVEAADISNVSYIRHRIKVTVMDHVLNDKY